MVNRIGEIQSHTSPQQWRHFVTEENSADRLTRGLSVEELASKDTEWEGPLCLEKKKSEWTVDRIMKEQ